MLRGRAGNPDFQESIQELTAAVARVRELRPQLLMLCDFRYAKSILEPQCSALPFAVIPDWPMPQANAGLTQYAEVCCQQWLWGLDRLIDPRRPYFLCGFGQSCSVAFEIGQQMSLAGQRPAAVILIGPKEGASGAPSSTWCLGWNLLVNLVVWIRERWGEDEPQQSRRNVDLLIRQAAQGANPEVAGWAEGMLAGRRRKGVELAPFPVFQLDASGESGPGSWEEERRCRIRAEAGPINLWRAPEVNAFLLRTLLSSSPSGLHLTREQQAEARSASATLEEVARQISEAEQEQKSAEQAQFV